MRWPRFSKRFGLGLLMATLSACASLSMPTAPLPSMVVAQSNTDTLTYAGRGQNAGFMLVAAMGPIGIGLGAAIDQGIARDIQHAYAQAGFEFRSQVETAGRQALAVFCAHAAENTLCGHQAEIVIRFEKVGFTAQPGDDDRAVPNLRFALCVADVCEQSPAPANTFSATLETLKTNGAAVDQLLQNEFKRMLNQLFMQANAVA